MACWSDDVNHDGQPDLLIGDFWYEAPNWTPHEIRKPGNYGDGAASYSDCMLCFADDVNGDGWADQIVIGFPGKAAYWYENPKGASGHWKRHEIWPSACNETPLFVDLFGTGKPVLVMGWQPPGKETQGQMAWFAPGQDPTQPWEMHPVSEPSVPEAVVDGKKVPGQEVPGTRKFSHGLGVGDVNGDGRQDVICKDGWWEQPAEGKAATAAWKFHPAKLGEDCSNIYAFDVDGDGKADVISSSAHRIGIWCHLQKPGANGEPTFLKTDLFPDLFSQTHALHFVDLDGDGLKDLVTGKRWWAHGPKGDVNPNSPAVLYWFKAKKGGDGVTTFTPYKIDDDSGIGTQFAVGDVNGDGKFDIAVANKKGVFLFVQEPAKSSAAAK